MYEYINHSACQFITKLKNVNCHCINVLIYIYILWEISSI